MCQEMETMARESSVKIASYAEAFLPTEADRLKFETRVQGFVVGSETVVNFLSY